MPAVLFNDVRDVLTALPHHSDVYGSRAWLTDPDHYPQYAKVFRALAPDLVLEIGTFLGYSLAVAAYVLPGLARVEWVDDESGLAGSNRLAEANIRAARAAAGHAPVRVEYGRGVPVDPGTPDLVHVDGDHSYRAASRDVRYAVSLGPKVVAGHDIALPGAGVRRAVEELGRPYFEAAVTNGLFVLPVAADRETVAEALAAHRVPGAWR